MATKPFLPKKVLMLGAGFSGTDVTVALDNHADCIVTIIDCRDTHVNKVGSLRAAVDTDWIEKVLIPRTNILKNGTVIHGTVESVTSTRVRLRNGVEMAFDILICATGAFSLSVGEPVMNFQTRKAIIEKFKQVADDVEKANRVVILGGGAVAVELAGEIRQQYPKKSITLLQSQEHYCA